MGRPVSAALDDMADRAESIVAPAAAWAEAFADLDGAGAGDAASDAWAIELDNIESASGAGE